jgi:Kdo2-lipid IVA lauroyltransferase/acyltransferase
MKIWRQIRKVGEAILVCVGLVLIPFFPRIVIVKLSHLLGNIGFLSCGKLRRIAMANVDVAFGNSISLKQKEIIVRDSFKTFTLVVLDLFWFSVFSSKRIPAYLRFDPSFRNYFDRAPVVAATAHYGNWEAMGQAAALLGKGPLAIATPLDNAFVDWILRRWRKRTGQGLAERSGGIRTLAKLLKQGGRTALLMDQNTLPEEGGIFVNFFGLPVPVSKAVYALAGWSGSDIVPAFCNVENEGMCYAAYAMDPIKIEKDKTSEVEITQAVAKAIEEAIRRAPGQWLWMYKRWKYIPPGAPAEKYPFYAKKYERQNT